MSHAISKRVDEALPTLHETNRRRQDEANQRQADAEAKARQAATDRSMALMNELQAINNQINAEPGIRDSVKSMALRYVENRRQIAELEIDGEIDTALGLADKASADTRKAKAKGLAEHCKAIISTQIPDRLKQLKALQARLPKLVEQRDRLKREKGL